MHGMQNGLRCAEKGEPGERGPKGEKGDAGVAANDGSVSKTLFNTV